jgi:4-amino-4-deoxy-L-arabinose transferase-like glycosyltransferase
MANLTAGGMLMETERKVQSDQQNGSGDWPVVQVITGAFAFFVSVIIILGAFERGPLLLAYPTTLLLLFSLLLAAALAGLMVLIEKMTFLHKPFVFPVLISALTFSPRYVWIRLVETTPMWDFARYLHYAQSIVAGDPGAIADIRGVFPHLTGYPLILSIVMRLFGTEAAVARWFNLFCTIAAVLLLYELGKSAFSPRVGRGAALLFALWPGQIFYSSVIAAEHLFVMLLLASLVRFTAALQREADKSPLLRRLSPHFYHRLSPAAWGISFAAGAVLAVSHIIRPVASLLVPAFIIYLIIAPLHPQDMIIRMTPKSKAYWKQILIRRGPLFVMILAGFFLTLNVLNAVYEPVVKVPLGKAAAGFNLYVGTNQESRGMWNAEDWEIIEAYDYDFDRVHSEAWNRGVERIQEDYLDFLLLAERKYSIQWSVSEYGFYWGMLDTERVTAVSLWAERNRQELQVVSQVFYLSLMWLILIGLWKTRRYQVATFNTFIAILFFGFIAMHTLIEVQSRYHHSLVPLFMLSAAYGASHINRRRGNASGQRAKFEVS